MRVFATVLAIVVAIGGGLIWSQMQRVEAGWMGVRVNLLGSDQGVDAEEIGPGRYWIGINQDLFRFPTFAVNYVWTADLAEGSPNDESITFQSIRGLNVRANVGITYSIVPDKVADLFQRYRKGIDEITDTYLRNMVRDALGSESSKMAVADIYGTGKTDLMMRVEQRVRDQVGKYGIKIERIYWIGALDLPAQVQTAINDEIAANSRARQRENEVAEAVAAADKERQRAQGEADALLKVATAQAEANRLLTSTLSPEIIQNAAIQKWDGTLPRVTGESVPFIQVQADKEPN